MRIESARISEAETTGLTVREMGVAQHKAAKLYTILSDGLYKNKLMSIIRELSSNCRDSHVMAGRPDEPIVYTAPTLESPVLAIRDRGVGLTPAEAAETIFEFLGSAKDDSDDYIGGWGLGSKSPFAYTDAFEVVIWKDGARYEYNCWKDDAGLPKVALFHEEPTDEHDGVEVRVPIRVGDIHACTRNLQQYLARTRYRYTVTNPESEFRVEQYATSWSEVVDGTTVAFVRDPGQSLYVYYGGFTYDLSDIAWSEEDAGRIALWKSCLRPGESLYLHAEVQDCTFSVSRESLTGTARTYDWVMGRLRALADYIDADAQRYVDQYLQPLFDRFIDPETGKPLSATTMREVCESQGLVPDADTRASVFQYLSFREWTRNLSRLDGQFFVQARGGAGSGLFRIVAPARLEKTGYEAQFPQQRKPSNLDAFLRLITVGQRRRQRYGSYKYSVRVLTVNSVDVNLAEPIREQVRLLWSERAVPGKDFLPIESDSSELPRDRYVFLLRAPDADTARAYADSLGFVGVPLAALADNDLGLEFRDRPARSRTHHEAPVYVPCQHSRTRHDYYASTDYYYLSPEDFGTDLYDAMQHLSYAGFARRGHLVQPSATFLRRHAGHLPNLHEITRADWQQYFNLSDLTRSWAAHRAVADLGRAQVDRAYELSTRLREDHHPAILYRCGLTPAGLRRSEKLYRAARYVVGHSRNHAAVQWMIDNLGLRIRPSEAQIYPYAALAAADRRLQRSRWVRTVRWHALPQCPREMRLTIIREALKELQSITGVDDDE